MITIDIDFDAIRDKFVSVVGGFMDAGLDLLDDLEVAYEGETTQVFDFETYTFERPTRSNSF